MRTLILVALLSLGSACDESSNSNADAAPDLSAAIDLACTRSVGEPCSKAATGNACGACGAGLECIGTNAVCVFVDNDLGK